MIRATPEMTRSMPTTTARVHSVMSGHTRQHAADHQHHPGHDAEHAAVAAGAHQLATR